MIKEMKPKGRHKVVKKNFNLYYCFNEPAYSRIYTLIALYPEITSENIRKLLKNENTKSQKDKNVLSIFQQIKNANILKFTTKEKHKDYSINGITKPNPETNKNEYFSEITIKEKTKGLGVELKHSPIQTYFTKIHKIENKEQQKSIIEVLNMAYENWKNDLTGNNDINQQLQFAKDIIAETLDTSRFENLNKQQINELRETYGLPETEKESVSELPKEVKIIIDGAKIQYEKNLNKVEYEIMKLKSKKIEKMFNEMKANAFAFSNVIADLIIIVLMQDLMNKNNPQSHPLLSAQEHQKLIEILETIKPNLPYSEMLANGLGVSTHKQTIENLSNEMVQTLTNSLEKLMPYALEQDTNEPL